MGSDDFMRVPFPAARMITENAMIDPFLSVFVVEYSPAAVNAREGANASMAALASVTQGLTGSQ
ncbi:hypothetical protein GCM10007391_25730 [Alteromonas halophila]|uniref:Uncharacterized protein n=1 Tax=Alteromonas halophila TaxID=516698 RepID=A0A918JMU9_9ALTE|nr:hypothetical protein GCM10007391_25730 [Alteromonas halophila]